MRRPSTRAAPTWWSRTPCWQGSQPLTPSAAARWASALGGEAHEEAIRLSQSVASVGPRSANDLRRLLAVKTNSSYSAMVLSTATAEDAIRWASRLLDTMETVLTGP